MKLNIGKRILMFLHWLLSLLICAALALYLILPDFIMGIYEKLESLVGGALHMKIIGGAILAVYLVLVVVQLCLILKRAKRSERGFITVDSSETGRVRIAVSAIEQMVRQSVCNIDGIAEMKISIDNKDDAIAIGVASSIISGSHVPTITMNMQRAIRQFVEMNCGVAVRTVSISINSVSSPSDTSRRRRRSGGEAAQPAMPAPVPKAEPISPAAESVERIDEAAIQEAQEPASDDFYMPEPIPTDFSGVTASDNAASEEAPVTDEEYDVDPMDDEGTL